MIEMYRGERGTLERVAEPGPGVWIHVEDPSPEEIAWLHMDLGLPRDFVLSALDADEQSRYDRDEGAQLVLLRLPYEEAPDSDYPFGTLPLGIILNGDKIVTISRAPADVIQDFVNGQVIGWSTSKHNRFILQLLLRTASRYLRYLRRIDREVDVLEDRLQHSIRNAELLQLLRFQKSLVYFATALKSNELMMERLQRGGVLGRQEEDQELLEDVITENLQAIEMVGISNNILSQMMDAFASIISNNLSVVMKFLTGVTIILMVPTLVASFYGMNVPLPMQNSPLAWVMTIVLSLILCIIVVVIFVKKDWL